MRLHQLLIHVDHQKYKCILVLAIRLVNLPLEAVLIHIRAQRCRSPESNSQLLIGAPLSSRPIQALVTKVFSAL